MSAPLGPPGRRLRCDECGRRGHTARSHEPGGLLYVATAAAEPDLLDVLAERAVEAEAVQMAAETTPPLVRTPDPEYGLTHDRTPAQVLADAVESVRTSDEPEWAAMGRRIGRQTAQQLADAETAARRLDQVRRFITPAGEVKTISGPDATTERQRGLCADGAWTRDPASGRWYCAECDRPASAPILAEIAALQDDAPGQLVEVDLPPLQPRSRWEIDGTGKTPENGDGRGRSAGVIVLDDLVEGASAEVPKQEDAQVPGVEDQIGGLPVLGPEYDDAQHELNAAAELLAPDPQADPPVAAELLGAMAANERQIAHAFGVPPALVNDPTRGDLAVQHGPAWAPWATWEGPDARPRITLPGVYHLTDDEYHDPAVTGAWVSNSDLKAMTVDGCPAQWRYDRDNGVTDDREVYLFGKAVHAEVLGKGSSVVVRPAEWKDWRKAAAREWRSEQLAAGLVPVTPEEAETARAMAAAVHADPVAAEALSRPGRPEVALFWREQLPSGRWVNRRAMVDYLTDAGDPIDFKTAESANPNERMERAIYEYGYHRQAVTYEAAIVALDLSLTYPKMLFLFQQKKAPYLVTPVELDERAAVVGEGETRAALEVYADCVASGVWPGYGKAIMTIPEYRGREFDEEMT